GNRTMPVVEQLLESERLRAQVGQIAVPLGACTEPSNVKARGTACRYRYRCLGCEHFRTDPASRPELRDYLHQLLTDRERLATAVPQLGPSGRAATPPPAKRRSPPSARSCAATTNSSARWTRPTAPPCWR